MDGLGLLVGFLPLMAIAFLVAAAILSFAATTTAAKRRWRWAFGGCLTLMLGGCALVIIGMQGLAY